MRSLFLVALLSLAATGCLIEADLDLPPASPVDSHSDNVESVAQSIGTGSCVGHCGQRSTDCWCNDLCEVYGDCCDDYAPVCLGDALPGEPASVVSVTDGDTVRLEGGERVRLNCVDAPERNQPYGSDATRELQRLVAAGGVRIEREGRDRYGRTIGILYANSTDINRALILRGAGWNYDRYCGGQYQGEENQARAAGRGLWALPGPIAPWNWRRGAR